MLACYYGLFYRLRIYRFLYFLKYEKLFAYEFSKTTVKLTTGRFYLIVLFFTHFHMCFLLFLAPVEALTLRDPIFNPLGDSLTLH